ncbi:MAG: hypothetical protein LUD72_00055 [Bacteroidales bacterium]|nr:hypothetical protein [Bacteroidales bacterium]
MADKKQVKAKTLATVDAAVTILEKYPDLTTTETGLSYNISANPFELLVDILKHTESYEKFIEIIAKFIGVFLPVLEVGVKGILVVYLRKFLSCTLSPIITDDVLRRGVTVDITDIDLTDKLLENPLSTVGQYYYFGCEDYTISDEVKHSEDFDCLIWYMKNKSAHREVWGMTSDGTNTGKQKKSDGVITLEFHERSSSLLTDAEGTSMNIQTPYNNCLHVFIGNAASTSANVTSFEEQSSETVNAMSYIKQLQQNTTAYIDEIKDDLADLQQKYERGYVDGATYEELYEEYTGQIKALEYWRDGNGRGLPIKEDSPSNAEAYKEAAQNTWDSPITDIVNDWTYYSTHDYSNNKYPLGDILYTATSDYNVFQIEAYDAAHGTEYRSIKENYYYRHTLLEFNYDYVKSLKLFDAKVLTAQLIDQLVGILSIDLNISLKRQMIRNEVEKMVQMVVETDDTVVSDCFFSFSNDDYNSMLEKTELRMAGLYTVNGEQNPATTIDPETLLASLNGISADASEEVVQSVIAGTLTDISADLGTTTDSDGGLKLNVGAQMNIIDNLLNKLAMAIVLAVLSPKLILLIKVNLELVGQDTNFSLKDFIDIYKQMLVSLIRKVRDMLLDFILSEVMKILSQLAAEMGAKIYAEQLAYYMRLLRRLIQAWKRRRSSTEDWVMDDVDYADIYEEETDEEDEETADTSC